MATTAKLAVQAKSTVTFTGTQPNQLTSAAYITSDAVSTTANNPIDVIIEVTAKTGTAPTGNTQVVVFAVASLNWNGTTGTFTGTDAALASTNESSLTFLGTVPVPALGQVYTKDFSLFSAFGFVPPGFKIILKNDLGQTLTTDSAVSKAEVFATSV
jgi:hypothetical protein